MFVTEAETALERELSKSIMRSDATSKPRQLQVDETLTEQGETGDGMQVAIPFNRQCERRSERRVCCRFRLEGPGTNW